MIKNVMLGKDEGTDDPSPDEDGKTRGPRGVVGRVSMFIRESPLLSTSVC